MKKNKIFFQQKKAQAVMELAIFGAVFLYVLGTLVNKSMVTSYSQNAQIRAMRIALATSYHYSHTKKTTDGSRNAGSVYFIEDRLSAGSEKYGSFDRVPIISVGVGSLSRNIYIQKQYDNRNDLPRTDMFINGKHIQLTSAGFRLFPEKGKTMPTYFYQQVVNHKNSSDVPTRAGLIHPAALANGITGATSCTAGSNVALGGSSLFGKCLWGWKEVSIATLSARKAKNMLADVDGDMHEETILQVVVSIDESASEFTSDQNSDTIDHEDPDSGGTGFGSLVGIKILDYQRGQIDLTRASHEVQNGLLNDLSMDSNQQGSFVVDGGYRSPNRKGTYDTISRKIRLNNGRNTAYDSEIGCSSITNSATGDICNVTTIIHH